MLAALIGCFALTDRANAELQWQRGKTGKSNSATASQRSLRFKQHPDRAVQPAAFEEEVVGPRLTSGDEGGRATFRSIVVNSGDESKNNMRSAQRPDTPLPSTEMQPAETQPATSGTGERYEREITTPFGGALEPLPTDEPGTEPPSNFEPPSTSEPNDISLPPENNLRQPDQGTSTPPRQLWPPERDTTDSNLQQEITPDVTPQTPEPGTTRQSCEESWTKLKSKTIGTVDLSISVTGTEGKDFPYECLIQDQGMSVGRCWPQITYLWKASALCHKPLYFEDEQLERYGHSWPPCVQPFVSGAHFFCTLPVLPYCMGVEPPTECIYALGHYRPGSCAPYMCDPIPLSARGALFQAGAATGAAFVIP